MTAPTFPYPHRTVEEVVRDGLMSWPEVRRAVQPSAPQPERPARALRRSFRPDRLKARQLNPRSHGSLNP